MPWYAIALLVLYALNLIATPYMIGRPRKPITPGFAVVSLIINGLCAWAVIALAVH